MQGGGNGDSGSLSQPDGPLPASPMKGEVKRARTGAESTTTQHPPLYGEGWGGAVRWQYTVPPAPAPQRSYGDPTPPSPPYPIIACRASETISAGRPASASPTLSIRICRLNGLGSTS